jgi:two-component system LytT family response regulator
MTRRVTAVLVEDEIEARRNLEDFLASVGWIEVVGEARDGREAIEVLERLRPDLVFLDVRLPEMDGLRVLERLRHAPEVIFTTAYDEHALAAFEIGALDYLVKPFGRERLVKALERIRRRFSISSQQPAAAERLSAALGAAPIDRLYARDRDRIVPVPVREIRRIAAQGDYAEVHTAAGTHLLHISLAELESRLDPAIFRRVHRSHIVNLDSIVHLRRYDDRRLVIVLSDGAQVVASRAASEKLRSLVR